jgi:hypothetical protein
MSWFYDSNLDRDQLLLIVNDLESVSSSHLTKTNSVREAKRDLEAKNIDWIELSGWKPDIPRGLLIEGGSVLADTIRLAVHSITDWFVRPHHLPTWKFLKVCEYQVRATQWKLFAEQNDVRVIMHHFKTPSTIPLASGINNAGGITIFHQWSSNQFQSPLTTVMITSDVVFLNGELYKSLLLEQNRDLRTTAVVGKYTSDITPLIRESADSNRNELKKACDFILGIYDNTYLKDNYFTPTVMTRFYNMLLDLALEDETIGLVIKPKQEIDSLEILDQVTDKVEKLKDDGRCLVLDHRKSGIEAALTSDLTVGIGINSAVLEGLRAGTPGIHFDPIGMEDSIPYYEDGRGQFIVTDEKQLLASIQAARDNPDDTRIGDHRKWMARDDPFRDDKSGYRIGEFIRWFLEACEQGYERDEAMKQAREQFAQNVGSKYLERHE